MNAEARGNLAALFPDGTLDPDSALVADNVVRKMRFSSDRQTIFVAGHFTTIDGQCRQSVARLNVDAAGRLGSPRVRDRHRADDGLGT